MYFDNLPNEIITHIFLSLPNISSAIALSSTSHRFQGVYHSSKRLLILSHAAEAELGPSHDLVQLATHNASQPAHIPRDVPISDALLHQIVRVGRVAQRWEEIYPFKKWKSSFENRRLLSSRERFAVRRAVYRLWLFDKAFHNASHVRTCRGIPEVVRERAALLHNFSTLELAEMLDVQNVIRDLVANNVCPSNGKIRHRVQKRFPETQHHLLLSSHLAHYNAPRPIIVADPSFHNCGPGGFDKLYSNLQPSRWHEPGAEGWGDDVDHYYVVEDMMKLDPEQVLRLRDNFHMKSQVEGYVKELGEWFVNNGQTFGETLAFVLKQRGSDIEEMRAAIEDGEVGVAVLNDS